MFLTTQAFWDPVLRSWLSYTPAFIVGIGTLVLQSRRLRKDTQSMVDQAKTDIIGAVHTEMSRITKDPP